jgi:acetyl-CoA carboxylase alpha subunit
VVTRHLAELKDIPTRELLEQRYKKFRRVGEFAGDVAVGA